MLQRGHSEPIRCTNRERKRRGIIALGCCFALLGLPAASRACDICAIYTATEAQESRRGLRLGAAEQLSRFTTLQRDGEEIANPNQERLESSITQLVFGYQFHPRLGVQLNLPVISRRFRRLEQRGVVNSDETGFGDLSLLANVLAYSNVTENGVVRFSLLGGLKLPSGDSSRLGEEVEEGTSTEAGSIYDNPFPQLGSGFRPAHDTGADGSPSGIHGHDLALGSGSTDLIFGGQLYSSWKRLFVSGVLQYVVRTEGSFDYEYADDLTWFGGPGAYLWLGHDLSLAGQAVLSGETKGVDSLAGQSADDTGLTALYVGPGFHFTWGSSLGADLAADLPVVQNNTAVQIVADFRLRGGIVWRF